MKEVERLNTQITTQLLEVGGKKSKWVPMGGGESRLVFVHKKLSRRKRPLDTAAGKQ